MPQQTVLQASLRRCRKEESIVAERVHHQEPVPQEQRNKQQCQPQERSSSRSFVYPMHAWEWDCGGGTLLASKQGAQDTFCCPSKPGLGHCNERVQLQQQQHPRESLFHAGMPYPLDGCSGSSRTVRSPRTSTAAQSDYHSSKSPAPPGSHTSLSFYHDYYTKFVHASCGASACLASNIPAIACTARAAACTAPAIALAACAATSSPGAPAKRGGIWNAPTVHEGKRCLPRQWHAAFPRTLSYPRGDRAAAAVPRLLGSRSAGVAAGTSPATQTATTAAQERTSRASNAHAAAAGGGGQVRVTPAARQSSRHSASMEDGGFYSCPSTFPLQFDSISYTTAGDASTDTLPAAHAAAAPLRTSDSISSASASSRLSSFAAASTSAAAAFAASAAVASAAAAAPAAAAPAAGAPVAGASAAASARVPFWREATADPGEVLACHRGAEATATARLSIDALRLSGEGTPLAHRLSSSVRPLSSSASSQGGSGSSFSFCAGITQKLRSCSSTSSPSSSFSSSSSSLPYSSSFRTAAPAVCGPSRGGEREGRHDVADFASPAGCAYTLSDDVDFNTVHSSCASTFSRKTSSNRSSIYIRQSDSLFNFASTAAASSGPYPAQSAGPSPSRSSSGCPSTTREQQHLRPLQPTGGLSPAAAAHRSAGGAAHLPTAGAAARVCAGGAARLSVGAASLHDASLCSPLAADASSAVGHDSAAAAAASRARRAAATEPLFPATAVVFTSASPWPAVAASPQEATAPARRAAGRHSFLLEKEVLPAANRIAQQQGIRPGLSRQPTPRRSDPLQEKRRDFQQQPRYSALSPTHMNEEIISLKTSSSSSSSSTMGVHSSTNKSSTAAARSRWVIAAGSHSRISAHAAASYRKDWCDAVSPEEVLRERRRYMSAAGAPSFQGKKLHPRDVCMQRNKTSETFSRGSVGSIRLEGEFHPAAGERLGPGTCCSYGVGKRLSSTITISRKLHAPASLQEEKSHHPGPPWSLHYSPKTLEEGTAPIGSMHAAGGPALFPDNRRAAAATSCPLQAFQAAAAAVPPLSPRSLHIDSAENMCKQATSAAAARHVCRRSAAEVNDAELPAGRGKSEERRTAPCSALEKAGDACKSLYREKRGGRRSCCKESLSATQGIYTEHIHAEESGFLGRMRARSSHIDIQGLIGQNRQQQQLPLSSCVDQSAAAGSDAFAAEERFIFSETLREGCTMLLSPNCHAQQQQWPSIGDLPPASRAAAAGLLQQQCSSGASTGRTDRQRSPADSSLFNVVSSLPTVSFSASKTGVTMLPELAAAVAALPDTVLSASAAAAVRVFPPPAATDSPRLPAGATTHAAVSPAAAIQAAATQAAATKAAATQVAATQPVATQAAVPSVTTSFASERAFVRCCLPPSLRRQFRVLQQVGRGMYGDVFVCALRRPAAAAVAAPKQQQQGAQLSQQQHRQQMQQFCPPQPSSAAAHHQQQRGKQQSEQQQEQQRLPLQRLQQEPHWEREMENIEMHSAVRSVSTAGCPTLPSSKFHAPCHFNPEQSTPSTAAAAAHTAAAAFAAADLVHGCMQRTPSAGAAATGWAEVWEEGAGGEQQLEYPEEEVEREQEEETPEEEEERDSCEDGRRQLYAMKRVRLPTSKLKALFGMEQQVLREVTLLRSLKHVNILRLHAFQFELEHWERRTRVPRGQQPGALVQQQQQQQRPDGYEKDEAKQQQVADKKGNAVTLTTTHQKPGALTSSSHRAPAAARLPSAAAAAVSAVAAASPRQQTDAPPAHVRIEQRYRPTFYLFFELCECDLAQVVDSTYEKFLDFWRIHVKEAAAAQAVSPTYIIQHLLQTSAHAIPRPGLDEEEVQLIAYQLFQAVAYCHSRDVMHRDIKPQNIMLLLDKEAGGKPHWVVKLGDFGLACHAYMRDACRTQEVVTLLYRPPELLMGCTDYTTAVDVWSTGIVVAEMILGRPPFRGQASEADLLSRMQQWLGSPTPAELERLSVQPAALAEILKKREPVLPARATREDRLRLLLTDQFNRTLLSDLGIHFLASVLQTDPEARPSAVEMLQHPWLRSALEKFGNGEVYLRPLETTLPPDFLAVDPINFSFYFSPAQLTDFSDNDRRQPYQLKTAAARESQQQNELPVSLFATASAESAMEEETALQ